MRNSDEKAGPPRKGKNSVIKQMLYLIVFYVFAAGSVKYILLTKHSKLYGKGHTDNNFNQYCRLLESSLRADFTTAVEKSREKEK